MGTLSHPPDHNVDASTRAYCIVAGCVLALAGAFPLSNPDTFGHLAQGRQILESGSIPHLDPFSFWKDPPAPWANYEWLSDVLSYALYAWLGSPALVLLKCLCLAASGYLLVWTTAQVGGAVAAPWATLLLVLATPASRIRFSARPQIAGLLLSAAYLATWTRLLHHGQRPASRAEVRLLSAGLVLAHVAWVNLHGSHLLGLGITAMHLIAAWPSRVTTLRVLTILAAQVAASFVSPYGPAILVDALEHVLNPIYRHLLVEWGPFRPTDHPVYMASLGVQLLLLIAGARALARASGLPRVWLVLSLCLAVLAFRSMRFVADFLLLATPAIAVALAPRLHAFVERRWLFRASLAASLTLSASLARSAQPEVSIGLGENRRELPAYVGRWMHEHIEQPRLLAEIEDAWYLLFASPSTKVLIDGRVPFFGSAWAQRIITSIERPPLLEQLLREFDVDCVVLRQARPAHRAAVQWLSRTDAWTRVAVEDAFTLFVRTDRLTTAPDLTTRLPEQFTLDVLTASNEERADTQRLLRELPPSPNLAATRGWIEAILTLSPYLRPGGRDGLALGDDPQAKSALERSLAALRAAKAGFRPPPIVDVYHAIVAAEACELDEAEEALERAQLDGGTREALLVRLEIALRRGAVNEVKSFIEHAARDPRTREDVWLRALADSLTKPPRC
jgi:hypothetical protein